MNKDTGIPCGTFCTAYFYNTLMIKLLFIFISATCLGTAISAQPVLESSPASFDFGFTIHNSTIVHKLWLKSTGTDTVKVKDIQTGCSCTTIPLAQKEIAPGDSVEITISWDTQRTYGPVKRYPRIYYHDAEKPLRLSLFTNVQNVPDTNLSVVILPFKFELGRLPAKSVDSLEFKIRNNTTKEIETSLVSHLSEKFEIVFPKLIPAKSDSYGYIKIKPGFIEEEFEDSITLRFNHEEKYYITVPIRRKIYNGSPG